MSRMSGKWKNEITPYLAGIMDALVFLQRPGNHRLRHAADREVGMCHELHRPSPLTRNRGPVIAIYPDENTANDNSTDRYQAMIEASPKLRAYKTGLTDDIKRNRIGLVHMPIYFGWARSASSMANKPCRYAINDEVDKYVEGKRETSAILQTKNAAADL